NIKPNRYNWLGVGSDQNGSYNLRWLDAGTWSISISKEGYDTMTNQVSITADTQLAIELVRR
ncbi:MAG: PEGA domain-containing protein, partial [Vicinamibacterales bacterium]